jgi:phosphoglucosamine mutase
MIEYALVAGFASAGADVPLLATAGVSTGLSMRCDLGVMISASHNPYKDNGILSGQDGYKLSDEVEARIEALMDPRGAVTPPGEPQRSVLPVTPRP